MVTKKVDSKSSHLILTLANTLSAGLSEDPYNVVKDFFVYSEGNLVSECIQLSEKLAYLLGLVLQ